MTDIFPAVRMCVGVLAASKCDLHVHGMHGDAGSHPQFILFKGIQLDDVSMKRRDYFRNVNKFPANERASVSK